MKKQEQPIEEHPLKKVDWGIMEITIYRGCIVRKMIGGYLCFDKKVKTEQEVDELINNAAKSIESSLIL